MQINNQPQYPESPVFKQVSLVKVKKTLLNGTPVDFKDIFMKNCISRAINDNTSIKTKMLLSMIGLRKKAVKFFSFLEFPGYTSIMQKAEDLGTSYSWFKLNSGIDFKEPMDENYDSFWVLSKKDKDDYIDATPNSEMHKMMSGLISTLGEKERNNEAISDTFVVAQTAKWMNDRFEESIKGKEIKEIVIDEDYQMESIKKDLDL